MTDHDRDTLLDPRRKDADDGLTKAAVFAKLFDGADPPRVGRFAVLGQLGSGGMGIVYRAYDDKLQREVAVKLLQAEASQDAGSQGRQRLLREAQAMAKISHPNVLPVFEVGEHEDDIFVAMELVGGGTLRDWLDAEDRPWLEVVAMYLQAARGLAEAHARGLVHRDFKPENVLVGETPDGHAQRARVMDFGLAVPRSPEESHPDLPSTDAGAERSDPRLTLTGAILGTPAYMSPEQFEGVAADARSDQFSFCVALWEGLYRARPFAGSSLAELGANVIAGALQLPEDVRGVPSGIQRALAQGLATDPDARHLDLPTLIGVLEDITAPRRPLWQPIAASVGALALGGALATAFFPDEPTPAAPDEACVATEERLAGVWDDDVRADLHQRFAAADDVPYVRKSAAFFEERTDAWVEQWARQYEALCAAPEPQDPAQKLLYAQRFECLDSAMHSLETRAQTLADMDGVRIAASVLRLRLPRIDVCEDDQAVARRLPMPSDPDVRRAVTGLRRELSRVRRMISVDRARALQEAEQLAERARAVAYRPVHAEALAFRARVVAAPGDPASHEPLREAIREAELADHDAVVFDMMVGLHDMLAGPGEFSGVPNRPDPARDAERRLLLERLEVAVQRPGATAGMQAAFATSRSMAAIADGRFADAIAVLRARIEHVAPGSAPVDEARVWTRLADAQFRADDAESGVESVTRAVEIYDAHLGPRHPASAFARNRLAFMLMWLGHLPEALAAFDDIAKAERAERTADAAHLAWTLFQAGLVRRTMGQPQRGYRQMEEAERMLLEIDGAQSFSAMRGPTLALARIDLTRRDLDAAQVRIERLLGPGVGPETKGFAIGMASELHARRGDRERATEYLDQLAQIIALIGNQPKLLVGLELSRAHNHEIWGEPEQALAHAQASVAALDQGVRFDATFPFDREARIMFGRQLVAAGRHADAIPQLERGLEGTIGDGLVQVLPYGPYGHFALAQALWETGGERAAAREHARRAHQGFLDIGSPHLAAEQREVEAWIDRHGGR